MKSLFEDHQQPQPHASNHHEPNSGQVSKDDQEMGSNATSKTVVLNNSAFSCFPRGMMDLNLVRVVRQTNQLNYHLILLHEQIFEGGEDNC
jgi:hypothetical protein